jgi:hypothetical protein
MHLPGAQLTRIAQALREPLRSSYFPQPLWRTVLQRGWAYSSDIDDLLLALDGRLYRTGVNIEALAELAGYVMRPIASRPRFATAEYLVMRAMSAKDVAGFCIFLEHCGFSIDPKPMVESLFDQVASLPYMTLSEIEIYNFKKRRHRDRICLRASEHLSGAPGADEWRGTNGYRIESLRRGNQVAMLTVSGGKWRHLERVETTCPVCSMAYTKGDPESAVSHRREHARVTRLLTPRPNRRMRERFELGSDAELVSAGSPLWMQKEMYERAARFKREFGYDFMQWPDVGHIDRSWHGYLFSDWDGVIDGACAFNRHDDEWVLGWVWVRPERRHQGLLLARWPDFLRKYGDFWIEHPLSDAMQAFVQAHASPGQRRKIAERAPREAAG